MKLNVLAIIAFLCFSCKTSKTVTSQWKAKEKLESGVASWYGPGFQGKKTANGEIFDTNAYTAAHRTLPFGTKLRVNNLANGRSVIVRINDRGPYAKDRIIDLSKAAAKDLGMIEKGTTPVELFLINRTKSELEIDNLKKPSYTVQIGSFESKQAAIQKANQFKDGWVKRVDINKTTTYRVFIGRFSIKSEANKRNGLLQSKGVDGFVKQIEN